MTRNQIQKLISIAEQTIKTLNENISRIESQPMCEYYDDKLRAAKKLKKEVELRISNYKEQLKSTI